MKKNHPYSVLYLQSFHKMLLAKSYPRNTRSSYPFSTLACTAEIIPSRIPSGSFSVVDESPFPLLREDKVTIKMALNTVSHCMHL